MRVAILSAANSIHTARWANGLNAAGCDVHLISQHPATEHFDEGVNLHIFPYRAGAGYFLMIPKVRRLLDSINPHIVNAHFASGYGTTARLVGRRPWLLSVWGSDVYDFPRQSFLHNWLVKSNLLAADRVASTSHCMAKVTRKLAPGLKDIAITPFGVNTSSFESIEPVSADNDKPLIIGTVKTMAYKYGIDTLIEAFSLLIDELNANKPELAGALKLRLVGDGTKIEEYKELADSLGLQEKVEFVGRVPHDKVPLELSHLDIYVALSRLDSESFGVAIIEASAAGRPVVVSDAGGLPEVVIDGVTGLVVPREDPHKAALALEKLVLNPSLRRNLGDAGRSHVAQAYSWSYCVELMLKLYSELIAQ